MCKMLGLIALLFASVALGQGAAPASSDEHVLRVCADPDNLPLSNARGEGYENKIAEQLARDLGRFDPAVLVALRAALDKHGLAAAMVGVADRG